MDRYKWAEISSRQFKRYILGGGDMAALPVGSMEVMGPHLPVGANYFIAKAVAEELCRAHGGFCLPPVPFSPICGAKERGGVGLDCQTALDYITDAVAEAHENGIRRMLLVGSFDELYYVTAEIFQEYDIPLAHIDPALIPAAGPGAGEHLRFTALTAGSLALLGEEELLNKTLEANAKCLMSGGYRAPDDCAPISGLLNVVPSEWRSGVFPHFYGKDEYKILPADGVDAEAAAAAIRAWASDFAGPLAALAAYAQVFPRARYDRGMRMGGVGYGE